MRLPSNGAGIRAQSLAALVRARPPVARPSAPFSTSATRRSSSPRHLPPYGPVGVGRAVQASSSPLTLGTAAPTIFAHEFSLADRVALVTGANGGIGLEMALALVEAGARAVYCVDLPEAPGEGWVRVREYAKALEGKTGGEGRLEYISADVRDQEGMWKIGKAIGDREGRMDACVAAAGILPKLPMHCLTYSAEQFREVLDVNVNGVLFTAQAAGQQMERFGNGGSIMMLASIAGSRAIKGMQVMSYGAAKSAVLQLARSMASELGPKRIRVNSISPGAIKTSMAKPFLESTPEIERLWRDRHQLGRLGRPDELRGVAVWLASDASSFCTGSEFFVSGGYQAW